MVLLHGLVLLVAVVALLRDLALLPALFGYLRGTRVRDFEKEPTPRMRLLVRLRGEHTGLEENALAALRQNYPPFQARFVHADDDEAAADAARAAHEAVTDLAGDDADAPQFIAAVSGATRPDPLFLRDVAHGLIENDWVSMPSVLVGAEGRAAQLVALTTNVAWFGAVLDGGRSFPADGRDRRSCQIRRRRADPGRPHR